jgi:Holliday junction resolvasome RuvABC DNA-binding subunit
MAALLSLGYKTADAERAIGKSMEKPGDDASTEAIDSIRLWLVVRIWNVISLVFHGI